MAKHKHSNLAAATYLVFFLPMLAGEKNDPFLKYHFKQAVGLLILALSLQGIISIIGYWGGPQRTLAWVVRVILIIEVVVGMTNALRGEMRLLPAIGKHAAKL